jgi:F-type H+-transporting ATPase subunit b
MPHAVSLLGASSPLTKIIPGLMIWTLVFFFITFYVLKRYAFGPLQKMIDERRESIRSALESADEARDEARRLLEEHRKLVGEARGEAEQILAEARRTRESMEQRMREETEAERQRRLEETRREIAAETARALEQIRAEVADLTLEAAGRVVGRALDPERDRALIEEAIGALDFSRLEETV